MGLQTFTKTGQRVASWGMASPNASVTITGWSGSWPADDPDANFKVDIAAYDQARQMIEWLNLPLDRPEICPA